MSISILVEPTPQGFRAVSGSPLDLDAVAESAVAAVDALRAKISDRLRGGAMLIEQNISTVNQPVPLLPLAENPLFDDWLAEVEKYRAMKDAEELVAELGE